MDSHDQVKPSGLYSVLTVRVEINKILKHYLTGSKKIRSNS